MRERPSNAVSGDETEMSVRHTKGWREASGLYNEIPLRVTISSNYGHNTGTGFEAVPCAPSRWRPVRLQRAYLLQF